MLDHILLKGSLMKFAPRSILAAVVLFACFAWALAPRDAAASDIADKIKTTIDQVIDVVKDPALKSNKELRRQRLKEIIGARFNYRQMVMRSLAKAWDDISEKEREEFIELYKKLLENSYAGKIENFSDEVINYTGEQVKGEYALVKTEIVRKDGVVSVDYKLIKDGGDWMVYDFVIEGVSMVRNYRSQFTQIIRKDSYQVLVQKLTNKIQQLELNNGEGTSENL